MKKSIAVLLTIVLVILSVVYMGVLKQKTEVNKEELPLADVEADDEAEEVEERFESITMVSIGDIMYHSTQIKEVDSHPSGYDFHDSMALTKPYFENADITIGNYESTTTPSQNYRGYPTFNTPVESLDAIQDAGFDILSTINNHSLDSGRQGVIDTYDSIVERGMIPLGTRLAREESSLKVIEEKGIKLGFLAYTYGYNGLDGYLSEEEHEYMVSPIHEETMEKDIKGSVEEGNDLTVVMIHWGNEYQIKPTEEQRDLAHKMVEWGADIILGSHPHVVQEHEMIDDSFVIYSMGNYISDQRLETLDDIDTERGLMIEFTLEKNFKENKTSIKEINYHPLWVNKYWEGDRNFYEAIPTKDFINGKISPYVPEGAAKRIQDAYDGTMDRVNGLN